MVLRDAFLALALVFLAIPTLGFVVLALFEGFPKVRLGQAAGIVAIVAWFFAAAGTGPWNEVPLMIVAGAGLLLVFLATLRRELALLMLRRDDEFPGRHDRLAWFLAIVLAPAFGPWLFRHYRKARWPEPGRGPAPRARSSPWDDDEADEPATDPAGVA